MPIGGKGPKVIIGKELSQYILDDDPEAVFIDQREIGHGSFGAVYYVSLFPSLSLSLSLSPSLRLFLSPLPSP